VLSLYLLRREMRLRLNVEPVVTAERSAVAG
jgi:hypothetical protein